jgi:tetratricopeptide (TPR) repeat protein
MLTRAVPLLRILTIVLVVAIVLVAGLILRAALFASTPDVPKTEVQRGIEAAEEAVKANPKDSSARIKLAAAYMGQKAYNAAIEQAQIATRIAPKDPSSFYVLGLANAAKGDTKTAVTNLKKASGMKGQQAQFYQDAYVALARAQEKEGDLTGALASMQHALDQGPENAILLYERGQMFERNKKWQDALMDYGRALQYVPNMDEAQQAYTRVASAHPDALAKLKQYDKEMQQQSLEATPTGGKK